ncbi:MAG: hypothetical protein Fur0023_11110 [Bacteroidia bacterium]
MAIIIDNIVDKDAAEMLIQTALITLALKVVILKTDVSKK